MGHPLVGRALVEVLEPRHARLLPLRKELTESSEAPAQRTPAKRWKLLEPSCDGIVDLGVFGPRSLLAEPFLQVLFRPEEVVVPSTPASEEQRFFWVGLEAAAPIDDGPNAVRTVDA